MVFFIFLQVMRCFSSLRCPRRPMYSADASIRLRMDGFPIRRLPGQGLFGSYPRLIAAFRVLLRLLAPRHPPYALSSLTAILIADGPEKRRRNRITGSIFDDEDKESLCHFPLFNCQRPSCLPSRETVSSNPHHSPARRRALKRPMLADTPS